MSTRFRKLTIVASAAALLSAGLGFYIYHHVRTSNNSTLGFILLDRYSSPDGKRAIFVYQYDHGALGDSRVFWSIAPPNTSTANLDDYLLPEGYQACGWTQSGEAVLVAWIPYYTKTLGHGLNSGNVFKSAKIKVIPNTELDNQMAYKQIHQSL